MHKFEDEDYDFDFGEVCVSACAFLTGLESKGRPVRGWKAFVAVASNEWRFCFFQLLQGRSGEGL